jgi:hypothetical protein
MDYLDYLVSIIGRNEVISLVILLDCDTVDIRHRMLVYCTSNVRSVKAVDQVWRIVDQDHVDCVFVLLNSGCLTGEEVLLGRARTIGKGRIEDFKIPRSFKRRQQEKVSLEGKVHVFKVL